MASKEFRRPEIPADQSIKTRRKERRNFSDPLFDRDWEVFVIKRDDTTGELKSQTLCCDGAIAS